MYSTLSAARVFIGPAVKRTRIFFTIIRISMNISEFIQTNREDILGRWRHMVLSSYPSQGSSFLGSERDRFANPVGAAINEVTANMVDALIGGADNSVYAESLDRFMRVRAVQEFSASNAVSFVFMLKNAIIETPGWEGSDNGLTCERFSLFSRIDAMALDAFDRYASCREKLYEVSVNEFKRRNRKVLERLGLSEAAGDI